MAQSLPIDTLLSGGEQIVLPDEQLRDKIHFIINNVSQMNLDAKVQELKKILKPDHYAYLAHYLVSRRVSTEANFHQVLLTIITFTFSSLNNFSLLIDFCIFL
jgi:CCR4-NOT transcription complex subunit 1